MRCPLLICCNMNAFLNTASVIRVQRGCKVHTDPLITTYNISIDACDSASVSLQFLYEKLDKVKKGEAGEARNHFK